MEANYLFKLRPGLLLMVLFSIVISLTPQTAQACSCVPSSKKELFCAADIVLRAKILDTRTLTESGFAHTYRHRVENQLVLWSNNNYKAAPRIQFVETATEGSACGARLENDVTYILGGYKENDGDAINVNICDLIIDWDRLTQPERDAYENDYPLSCAGQIISGAALLSIPMFAVIIFPLLCALLV